jgi:putative transposase
MCKILEVAQCGYYQWLQQPISKRAREDARLLRLIRASFVASHSIYGAPRVFLDLREAGETCSKHRVERLLRQNGLRASVNKPSVIIPNVLQRQFTVTRPNRAWVTDITYFARGRVGSIWLASLTNLPGRSSAGPLEQRSIASSSSMPS